MMQCKDIPDDTVIRAIEATPGYWRRWEQVWPHFEEIMPDVPYNVFVAKVRRLNQRGLLHACVHDGKDQCRGDIHLPGECKGC
jgi:hypothetical protein